jgi:L-fucose mutarotase
MLKGIPSILSPDLIKILLEMGHGDEIVLGDGNFPAASIAKRLIRCDGHRISELLDAILKLFPLDYASNYKVTLMAVTPGNSYEPIIWEEYFSIVKKYEKNFTEFEFVPRFDFYENAKRAYAVVATGEKARFANIILRKGIIEE